MRCKGGKGDVVPCSRAAGDERRRVSFPLRPTETSGDEVEDLTIEMSKMQVIGIKRSRVAHISGGGSK